MAKKGTFVFAKGGKHKHGQRVIPATPAKKKGELNEIAESMGYEHVSQVPDDKMNELADKMVKKFGKKSAMGMARAQVVFRKHRKDGTEKKFEKLDEAVRKVEEPSSASAQHMGKTAYELSQDEEGQKEIEFDEQVKQEKYKSEFITTYKKKNDSGWRATIIGPKFGIVTHDVFATREEAENYAKKEIEDAEKKPSAHFGYSDQRRLEVLNEEIAETEKDLKRKAYLASPTYLNDEAGYLNKLRYERDELEKEAYHRHFDLDPSDRWVDDAPDADKVSLLKQVAEKDAMEYAGKTDRAKEIQKDLDEQRTHYESGEHYAAELGAEDKERLQKLHEELHATEEEIVNTHKNLDAVAEEMFGENYKELAPFEKDLVLETAEERWDEDVKERKEKLKQKKLKENVLGEESSSYIDEGGVIRHDYDESESISHSVPPDSELYGHHFGSDTDEDGFKKEYTKEQLHDIVLQRKNALRSAARAARSGDWKKAENMNRLYLETGKTEKELQSKQKKG